MTASRPPVPPRSTRPKRPSSARPSGRHAAATPAAPPRPLDDAEIGELQRRLEALPSPLEPLDVVALDGYLCGVLLQPQTVPVPRWLARALDVDGRPVPRGHDARPLEALILRRHAELGAAIAGRRWFDPWVFELLDPEGDEGDRDGAGGGLGTGPAGEDPGPASGDAGRPPADVGAVYPWVVGFATALELFSAPLDFPADAINEPLALIYRHLDAGDLEDADELLEEIESLEPPVDLADAVEGLVRATLLYADVTRPRST